MTDDEQGRLQEFGVDADAPPVDEKQPQCERCGNELDSGETGVRIAQSRAEREGDVYDVYRGRQKRDICSDCARMERYLGRRHAELTSNPGVSGAVAIFCACQDDNEVDVQPVRAGENHDRRQCSRCGSTEIVIEQLPPEPPQEEIQ